MTESILWDAQVLKNMKEHLQGVFPGCSHRKLGISVETWYKRGSVTSPRICI